MAFASSLLARNCLLMTVVCKSALKPAAWKEKMFPAIQSGEKEIVRHVLPSCHLFRLHVSVPLQLNHFVQSTPNCNSAPVRYDLATFLVRKMAILLISPVSTNWSL